MRLGLDLADHPTRSQELSYLPIERWVELLTKARKAIMRAVTDSRPTIDFAEGLTPGVDNLFIIHECLTGTTREQSQ
jgi:hypothetical protein